MNKIIRKDNVLDGKEFSFVNQAKKASRRLQKKGVKVRAIPRIEPTFYPVRNVMRLPHEIIHTGEKFWEKVKELRIAHWMLRNDWQFARKVCREHLWRTL